MEIAAICDELRRLGRSDALRKSSADACNEAAFLLAQFREIALSDETDALTKLRTMLASQGEG